MKEILGMTGFWLTVALAVYLFYTALSPLMATVLLLILATYLMIIFLPKYG